MLSGRKLDLIDSMRRIAIGKKECNVKESKGQFAQLAKETHEVTVRLMKSIIVKKGNFQRLLLPGKPSKSRIVPGTVKIYAF